VRTGFLNASIRVVDERPGLSRVVVGDDYGVVVNYGSRPHHMRPTYFLTGTLDASTDHIVDLATGQVNTIVDSVKGA
jgi:hypothetical protein